MAEIQEVRQRPAEFIEALGKTYADELTKTVGGLKDIDVSQLYGPKFVAGPGALTTQAEQMASGLGAYQPYLQRAEAATAPTAYQTYMSPYQQDVIAETLREYDIQAQKGIKGIAQQAIQAGAFGGGREGVQRAEYMSASDRNRAALQAQLLQQGFGQANQLAAQQFGQQMNLAGQVPALQGADIGALSAMGGALQQQRQAELAAQQQLNIQNLNQPLTAAQQYGSGVTSLIAGYPGKSVQEITPNPSGLSSLLGASSTLAGIYGALK